MPASTSAGQRLRGAVETAPPPLVVGTVRTLRAKRAGGRPLCLSGVGVARESFGPPDLRITRLDDVREEARRTGGVTDLRLPADGEPGRSACIMMEQRTGDRPIRPGAGCIGPGRQKCSAPEAP